VVTEAEAYVPEEPEPAVEAAAADAAAGAGIYERHCALCHGAGIGGAPVVGSADDWSDRIAQGMDVLYRHAIEGYQGENGVMPPRGGFMNLADAQVRAPSTTWRRSPDDCVGADKEASRYDRQEQNLRGARRRRGACVFRRCRPGR
jgi:cytochrome c5